MRLWELEAGDLFAAGDAGLIPWIPLTRSSQPPVELLTRCRDRPAAVPDATDWAGLRQRYTAEERVRSITFTLEGRFGAVPDDVRAKLAGITDLACLESLARQSGTCPAVAAFASRL